MVSATVSADAKAPLPYGEALSLFEEIWRRRPDLNRGWRFCRLNGVVNGVVSCWSLVGPALPFCPVFGWYWTTSGLPRRLWCGSPLVPFSRHPGDRPTCVGLPEPKPPVESCRIVASMCDGLMSCPHPTSR